MEASQRRLTDFGEENFASADLGDRRRTARLVRLANQLARHPGGTLPDKMQSPKDLKALYRLARPEAVTHAAVLEPARQRPRQRMAERDGVVLTTHDTTELDYTAEAALRRLGRIGNGSRRGYLRHNTLAVAAGTREVLGLANQILFRRPAAPKREPRARQRRRPTRESRLWRAGAEALGPVPPAKAWVDGCDRGADFFEDLDRKHLREEPYVVRSGHNRWASLGGGGAARRVKLHDRARRLPQLGRQRVAVPPRPGPPPRSAAVRIGAAAVTLLPPEQPRGEHRDLPLAAWVVYVGEGDPPAGAEALEWILLTDVPAAPLAEARERISWYECRPLIEEFHKAQKTGCGIENPQFEAEERLEPVIALLSVVAALLLQVRDLGRRPGAQARRAAEVVPGAHVEVLSAWRYGEVRAGLTAREFGSAVARLGGHLNRKRDGLPGWLTLWRGWTKLQLMVEAVAATARVRSG